MNSDRISLEDSAPARIVIAEDHPVVAEGLRYIVSHEPDLEVVGQAVDGLEVLELCRSLQPDLVLMDVKMPRMDGLEATRAIKREFPRTVVLVLTASVELGPLSEALKAGAAGYLLKVAPLQQLIDAIRRVLRGESPLNQELAMELLLRQMEEGFEKESTKGSDSGSGAQEPSEEHSEAELIELLTPREKEVLGLLVQGQTNQQIANDLFVSLSSVKKHIRRINAKLGVSDRVQAAVRAVELGLIPKQERE